tara:strand:+ start:1149 stop:1736 length:588 start_codon:yes stop_codon:yes gene_type:complete
MTDTKLLFLNYVKSVFPIYFKKKVVLDTGEYNKNYIDLFEDSSFYSSSISPHAKNGELISYKKKLFQDNTFNVILSMNCLENDDYREEAIKNLYKMLAYDGILLIGINPTMHKSINLDKLNQLLVLNENFSYWNCYNTEDNMQLFIGMKKYLLPELPIQPVSFEDYNKNKYNKKFVSVKSIILNKIDDIASSHDR